MRERDDTQKVIAALNDPSKHVIVQTAPAVRVGLGEEFGLPVGTIVTGKMVAALRRLGFDGVFDTNFSADLTIMEEGNGVPRSATARGENLPLITSCSPGWIKFCEYYYPDMLSNTFHLQISASRCSAPSIKTYYAEKMGIDPKDIVVVSIMPCTAKKFEAQRMDHTAVDGLADIDVVLTTRELARMIKTAGHPLQRSAG